jgi:hypothetical protein
LAPEELAAEAPPEEPAGGGVRLNALSRGALSVLLVAGLYATVVLGGRRWLARRRRAAAGGSASAQALVAWQEAQEALALAGHRRRPSETAGEFATRAARILPGSGAPMVRLAADTDEAGFSEAGVAEEAVPDAWTTADAVVRELKQQATVGQRLRWALDPRPLAAGATRPS